MTIDGKEVGIMEGDTILDVARRNGVTIPTLCYMQGLRPNSSCMVCVVEEARSKRLIPSCAAKAEDKMVIKTGSDKVINARRTALELLLSEHIGDCEAPCRRGCPAWLDIPAVIRHVGAGEMQAAFDKVVRTLVFPSVLGRICPASCEKVCRREKYDDALAIRMLTRFAGDWGLENAAGNLVECLANTGKKICVAGAGVAGLSSAFFLRLMGHECVVFESSKAPGGMVRSMIDKGILPGCVLDAEIRRLEAMGIVINYGGTIGSNVDFESLTAEYDAVVLAMGGCEEQFLAELGLETSNGALRIDRMTGKTLMDGVFGCGAVARPMKSAVLAVASAKKVAVAVDSYLRGAGDMVRSKALDVKMGSLTEGEIKELMKGVDSSSRHVAACSNDNFLSIEDAAAESYRCMHCDCRSSQNCGLRSLADEYGAVFRPLRKDGCAQFSRDVSVKGVVFEPGKCVKCGICVQIADTDEALGLTFTGRGIMMKVAVPFGQNLSRGVKKTISRCVESCPTGALAFE